MKSTTPHHVLALVSVAVAALSAAEAGATCVSGELSSDFTVHEAYFRGARGIAWPYDTNLSQDFTPYCNALVQQYFDHMSPDVPTWETGRGWNLPCKAKGMETYKHFLGGVVAQQGVAWYGTNATWHDGTIVMTRSFNSPEAYTGIMSGISEGHWHGRFNSRMVNSLGSGVAGEYRWREYGWDWLYKWGPRDTVTVSCEVMNPEAYLASTARRAGVLIHEGWHAHWGHATSGPGVHQKEGCDAIKWGFDACDHYYPHPKYVFPRGDTWRSSKSFYPISAYQMENEFGCDLADSPAPWVPYQTRLDAVDRADGIGDGNFIEGPLPYDCGTPNPLGGPKVLGVRYTGGPLPCSTDADCAYPSPICAWDGLPTPNGIPRGICIGQII